MIILIPVMRKIINQSFKSFYSLAHKRSSYIMMHAEHIQEQFRQQLVQAARTTQWGRQYGFKHIKSYEDYQQAMPIQEYHDLQPFIERMMRGEKDILWPGAVRWYSKSSGTTASKSKFIPVSYSNLRKCHIRGTGQTMMWFYHNRPDARMFELKSLLMGGSLVDYKPHPKTKVGDVSAIMIHNMPGVARPFFTPDFETALLPNWEEKLERMAQITAKEKDLVMIGGVPTWTVLLLRRVLEITKKSHLLEVWPHFQGYIHGGVSFTPYKEQFKAFFPSDQVSYQEIYNASEGYFAVQNDFSEEGMLLLTNSGVFYEFIPSEEWGKPKPKAVNLSQVELGKNYAIVISTNSGLWRYNLGDTVMFTSIKPPKIKITGRTKQFVNAFGEEVMIDNTDKALSLTCQKHHCAVSEYTVAPVYFDGASKGGHQWLIEFDDEPLDLDQFSVDLDYCLQSLNSDYEAKRYKDMALLPLQIQVLEKGTFHEWLRSKGKYGGQHKVPRLANHREYINDILAFYST